MYENYIPKYRFGLVLGLKIYISLGYKHTFTESLTRNKPRKYMLYK